jgi:Riboflavin kinase
VIVFVDLKRAPAEVLLLQNADLRLSVMVRGGMVLADLDAALARAGAGRAVGHHAELATNWLSAQLAATVGTSNVVRAAQTSPWSQNQYLDDSEAWVAAPIRWDDPGTVGWLPICTGVVEHGDARGRDLGFPTANLALSDPHIPDGVWAGWVYRRREPGQLSVISVGTRPTFYNGAGARLIEAHVLDFDGDLYGQRITVVMHRRLRGQRAFRDVSSLLRQISRDVASTRRWYDDTRQPESESLRSFDSSLSRRRQAGRPSTDTGPAPTSASIV